ncbi:E3 ubiquitin-protein ligase KCMF1-like [Diabrotica virgifera virgifera]|nr:E3 ubiquitin-protein ligase KCMF1-like [Diabrotica virgifera virgifera]
MHQNPKGFSCNSCQIQVLLGQRYKCLVCYDYDLCEKCYEHEAKINGHKTDHPFQGLITRSDPEDGVEESETLVNLKLPNYTCPICCSTGFTDGTLQDHVIADHKNNNFKVICPLCAAMPGRDPNLITDDFPGHLTLKHMHSE